MVLIDLLGGSRVVSLLLVLHLEDAHAEHAPAALLGADLHAAHEDALTTLLELDLLVVNGLPVLDEGIHKTQVVEFVVLRTRRTLQLLLQLLVACKFG